LLLAPRSNYIINRTSKLTGFGGKKRLEADRDIDSEGENYVQKKLWRRNDPKLVRLKIPTFKMSALLSAEDTAELDSKNNAYAHC
jgi:hypothetical protein